MVKSYRQAYPETKQEYGHLIHFNKLEHKEEKEESSALLASIILTPDNLTNGFLEDVELVI